MADSFYERRRKEIGLSGDSGPSISTEDPTSSEPSFYDRRRMDIGLIPDTRPKLQVGNDDRYDSPSSLERDPFVPDSQPTQQVQSEPSLWDKTKNVLSGIDSGVNSFLDSAANSATLGLYNKLLGYNGEQQRIDNQDGVIGTLGSFTGMALPVTGAYSTGGKLAGQLLSKVAPEAPEIVQGIVKGIGAGLTYGTADEAMQAATGDQQSIGGRLEDVAKQGALFGAGDAAFGLAGKGLGMLAEKYAGTQIGDALGRFMGIDRSVTPDVEQQVPEMLALPSPRVDDRINAAMERSNLPYGDEPVAPYGESAMPALPEGNYIPPQRLKVESNPDTYLNRVMEQIKPIVTERMTPPMENPNELAKWVHQHLGVEDMSLNEVRKLPYDDLAQMADEIRQNINLPHEATKAAAELGYDLPALLDRQTPNLKGRMAADQQARVYGVYPDALPNVRQPEGFNVSVRGQAAAPQTVPSRLRGKLGEQVTTPRVESAARQPLAIEPPKAAEAKPMESTMQQPINRSAVNNERGFNTTVRTSQQTPESLSGALESSPGRYKVKPNEVLVQDAHKTIEKMGEEGAYNYVMNSRTVNDRVNAVAQILARRASESGNLERAIDLVSKTAQRGTELGRAIQSLSLWNRMDAEGALLVGERQLNRGIKNPAEYQKLSTDQAKPIIAATERVKEAERAKSLAQEVMDIVSNKKPGEQLTDEELSKIKQFQQQVSQINDKVKGFVPDKAVRSRKIIEDVNKIDPKDRTIVQLQDYWDARAERARQKLAKQRNMGLIADTNNPVLLYAELGVAKLAKGFLSAADFADSMMKDYGNSVKGIVNQVYEKSVNMFRKSQGLPTTSELNQVVSRALREKSLDEETAANFRNWASKIAFYTDETMKKEAVQDLQLALKALGKPTIGQKIASIQTQAQLLSLPTMLRNVAGNELFNVVERLNRLGAVPIDWTISKFTGNERTLQFVSHNQESYWKNWLTGTKAAWKGVNPEGALSNHDMHPSAFSGKYNPLTYTEKALGVSLQSFDYAAYKRAEGEVLYGWASRIAEGEGLKGDAFKARINELAKNAPEAIQKIADEAGKYATFQDETALSKLFAGTKNLLNKVGVEGFGLGDVVLKYAKTPANLIMRSIDYSPAGLLRGIYMLTRPLFPKSKGFDQRATALALSRGLFGTMGMSGLGYILASNGILSGSASSDKDIRDLQRQIGQGAYQVNLSALKRWVTNGFDHSTAKYQQGDTLMNYDWLVPAAMSLAMAVNATKDAEQMKKGQVSKSLLEASVDAISGGLKTIMEQSLMQGISNLANIDTRQDNWAQKKVMDTISGIPSSFVPALLSQTRNFTDNTARSTYDPNQWQSMMNQVINRIPWLSAKLPIAYDSLGKPRPVIQGGESGSIGQLLNTFVNPSKITSYSVSPDAKLVVDLLNTTNNKNVAPREVGKTLTVNKQQIQLSPDQFTQLQQETGQNTSQMLKRIAPMLQNPNIKDDSKAKAVVDVLTKAGEKARFDLERQMGVTPKRR